MSTVPTTITRRRLLCRCGAALAAFGALGLVGCSRDGADAGPATAVDFGPNDSCALDGMLLHEYPGPKGQLLVSGQPQPVWYCDTLELLNVLLEPEQVRRLRGAWVQDMARADWERPRGHWIDARQAHYVLDSSRQGAMGDTAASFADAAAAGAFQSRYGGRVLVFTDIGPGMIELCGGALHDDLH